LTNDDIAKIVDTSDDWIVERTGIRQRHIAEGEGTSDLAYNAARNALESAQIEASDLDMIVLGTTTPDRVYPATACQVQARLGAGTCPAFDVQAVCTGFMYALSIGDTYVRSGAAKRVLVIGADVHSKLLDWTDRATCVLFGDGAGAVVIEAAEEPGIFSTHIHADGTCEDLLYVDGSFAQGYDNPTQGPAHVKMQGNEVFRRAVRTLGSIVDETVAANGMEKSDVDWLVPHQANRRIIDAMAKRLGMSTERVVMTIEDQGNTSAASVPLALDTAVADGRIKRGDILLLEAFGGGFTWGSALIRY
jgi:3-oxoacyl-[acyl-carrier-protein] synthase-3